MNKREEQMKVFKRFSAIQIARYVKSFHRGAFMVESVGEFRFANGLVTIESQPSHLKTLAGQVNQLLRSLRCDEPLYA